VLALLLVGCAAQNPTAVPTPAPIQVASDINKIAQSVDAATTAIIAARDQGKMSQADANIGLRVAIVIATTDKQLNAELRSTDSWDTQKIRMRQIVTAAGLAEISKQLPPTARQLLQACLNLFNTLSAGFGGPII
jgi:PBP1b-binding outer membrane lipoprotein LpoB